MLRQAGLKRALVSSRSDEGTQKLLAEAPDLVVPVAAPLPQPRRDRQLGARRQRRRPTSRRGWANRYVAIGEYHVYGADADLPVCAAWSRWRAAQAVPAFALRRRRHRAPVQAGPEARILWAHSGFERPEKVREMLRKHKNLWCDLAFRSDHAQRRQGRPRLARGVHGVPRPLHGRHRHLHARALVLRGRTCELVARRGWPTCRRRWPSASPGATARRCSRAGWRAAAMKPCEASRWLLGLLAAAASLACAAALAPGRAPHRAARSSAGLAGRRRRRSPWASHFAIDFVLCPRRRRAAEPRCAWTRRMPEHRHGMNYRPSVTRAGRRPLARRGPDVPHARPLGAACSSCAAGGAPLRLTQSLQVG